MGRWGKRAAVALCVLACLFGLKLVLEEFLIEYVVQRIIVPVGIAAILAVGLNLVNGTTGQFSIGHAGFMAVGAYGASFTVIQFESAFGPSLAAWPPYLAHGLALNVGLLVGAGLAGVAGLLVGAPSLRLRGDYLAIVTLGFGEIIRLLFNNTEALGGATGYSGGRPLGLPNYTDFFWAFAWAALIVTLIRNLTYSSPGRALTAIREDEIAAEAVGIPTTRFKVLAFVVSAASAGIAGGLCGHLNGIVRPDDFKFDKSIDVIVMIIIGGMGSVTGAIVGAAFVAVTLELMRDLQEYRLVVYALLLILLMIFRPQGILGTRELRPRVILARLRGARAGKDGGAE